MILRKPRKGDPDISEMEQELRLALSVIRDMADYVPDDSDADARGVVALTRGHNLLKRREAWARRARLLASGDRLNRHIDVAMWEED